MWQLKMAAFRAIFTVSHFYWFSTRCCCCCCWCCWLFSELSFHASVFVWWDDVANMVVFQCNSSCRCINPHQYTCIYYQILVLLALHSSFLFHTMLCLVYFTLFTLIINNNRDIWTRWYLFKKQRSPCYCYLFPSSVW